MLLLHNEEDICDLVPVTALLTYMDLLNADIENLSQVSVNDENTELMIETELCSDFPISFEKMLATKPGLPMINIETVGKSHRIQATKATAYTWASGSFIPQYSTKITPYFKADISDFLSFIPVKILNTDEQVLEYIKSLSNRIS